MAGWAGSVASATISEARSWANKALSDASSALNALVSLEYPYIEIPPFTLEPFIGEKVELPPAPVPLTNLPSKPRLYDVTEVQKPSPPSIDFGVAPTLTDIVIPSKPSMSTPTLEAVSLGSLLTLNIPEAPVIALPDLSVTPPEEISITPGSYNFTVDNILILSDPMVKALMDRLLSNIENGGTGLDPTIEAEIWNRELERMEQQLSDSTDKVTSMWAKKGFSLPDGLLAHSLSELQKEWMNKRVDRSREIAIEQAKLEQTNLFKSMEIAGQVIFKLIDSLNEYQKLVMDALERTAKYSNEYIRLQVETHNSNIELFKARVQMHEINIRAALNEVEVYKAQLEGELAKVSINEATVRVYSEQIKAALAKYNGVLDGNKSLTEIFTAEVQAAIAEAQIQESLVKVFGEKVRAAGVQIEAYKAEVDAMVAELQGEKTKIDANVAKIQMWRHETEVDLASARFQLDTLKVYGDLKIAEADNTNKVNETSIRLALAAQTVNQQNAELQIKVIDAAAQTKMEAAKAVASASASMAAGAMAAVNASASMSYSESGTFDVS